MPTHELGALKFKKEKMTKCSFDYNELFIS